MHLAPGYTSVRAGNDVYTLLPRAVEVKQGRPGGRAAD